MNAWLRTIDTPLEWIIFAVVVGLALALYFSAVWFVQKFATGILGGLILMVAGLALILPPAYTIISEELTTGQMFLYVVAIFAGCISTLVGVFSLRDFQDF